MLLRHNSEIAAGSFLHPMYDDAAPLVGNSYSGGPGSWGRGAWAGPDVATGLGKLLRFETFRYAHE